MIFSVVLIFSFHSAVCILELSFSFHSAVYIIMLSFSFHSAVCILELSCLFHSAVCILELSSRNPQDDDSPDSQLLRLDHMLQAEGVSGPENAEASQSENAIGMCM